MAKAKRITLRKNPIRKLLGANPLRILRNLKGTRLRKIRLLRRAPILRHHSSSTATHWVETPEDHNHTTSTCYYGYAEGTVERADDLKAAFERARKEVVENGRVALVDVYTQVV